MAGEPTHFWGWPGARNLAYAYLVLGVPVFAWFVLIYAGCDYLTGLHDYRVPCYFEFEKDIPFVPASVLLYNSLHLATNITPFILRTRPEMNALAAVWVVITFIAGVVFLILPFDVGYAEPAQETLGPWRAMYEFADAANLRYNSLPSLHVAWGVACVDVFATKARTLGKCLLWLWGVGMMASTVLLHQHHLSDVAGGLALALVGARILYPRFRAYFQATSAA